MRTLLPCCVLLLCSAAGATDFYISPSGNDDHPGSQEKPFATLQRARDAVRALKAAGPLAEPVRVNVADGVYTIDEPLVLSPEDSGTAQAPVIYQAAPGARPVFSGGRAIGGWQAGPDGVWTAQVPEVAAGQWYFEQLFVNGRRATRARTPNKFYFYIQDVREETTGSRLAARPKRAPPDGADAAGRLSSDRRLCPRANCTT